NRAPDYSISPEGRRRARRFLSRKRADAAFLTSEGLGWRGGAVLAWSGMRGVVTLAAAQSLPVDIPYRPQLILIAFTVAVATLLVNGGTLPLLIRKLRIVGTTPEADQAELTSLVGELSSAGLATLDNPELLRDNGFTADVIARVRDESILHRKSLAERSSGNPGPHEQHRALRLRVLEAERAALLDARATGAYSSRILERAQTLLDLEEYRLGQL